MQLPSYIAGISVTQGMFRKAIQNLNDIGKNLALNLDNSLKPEHLSLEKLKVRGKTWTLYWINFGLFLLLKILIRPWLREHEVPEFFQILSNSFPNYAEAYLGTFTLATIFLVAKVKGYYWFKNLSNRIIYLLSALFAAIFVITQEMNIHSFGGDNIYDFNDIIASIIGLLVIYVMLNLFGTGIQNNQKIL